MTRPALSRLRLACIGASLLIACAAQADDPAPPADAAAPPATDSAPPPVRAPLEERSVEDASSLERQLPLPVQQILKAGDESFLALWQAANVGDPSGLVILVPGDGESADWPVVIAPLRTKLPDAGWSTLSVTLPDPQDTVPPRPAEVAPLAAADAPAGDAKPEEKAEDKPTEAATEATPPATAPAEAPPDPETLRTIREQRVLARLDAALGFAKARQAKRIVLLGHGSGAWWAAHYLAAHKSPELGNLLMVSAAVPDGYVPPLEDLVPGLGVPTGDYFYKDLATEREAALKRLQASKRAKHPAYEQIALKALPGNRDIEQEQLFRRIKGWLSAPPTGIAPAAPPGVPGGSPAGQD